MEIQKYNELLSRILELLDTACQASFILLDYQNQGDKRTTRQLLSDIRKVITTVTNAKKPLIEYLEHAYTTELLENVEDTLNDIEKALALENTEYAAMKMQFQLTPFLRILQESFYFWGAIYPNKNEMDRYYKEEFAEHYKNLYVDGQPMPYRLSIVVPAYNHLEMTRRCIEQIYKETDFERLHAELILIDHGSTDNTLTYFESLGVKKVIHFKNNVRTFMFALIPQVCQGDYFCFFSNDILATRGWADILLRCLDSDEKIISVVPATPNIANLQMLNVPTNDPDNFIDWANRQNQSNPALWDERARLMPPIAIYRMSAINQIGFADPYFYSLDFEDDDRSIRARRAGWRQILCSDVACYHFGSITTTNVRSVENSLTYGRKLFENKYGIDPWGNGFCYDYSSVHLLLDNLPTKDIISILGLDCGMGDTTLQIQNELRHRGQRSISYQLTSQKQYLPDLKPLFKNTEYHTELAKGLKSVFPKEKFSCVCLGRDIAEYEDPKQLLEGISYRMVPKGCLVFSCVNPFFALTLHTMLQFSLPEKATRHILGNPSQIGEIAKSYFSHVQQIAMKQYVEGVERFAKLHYGKSGTSSQILKQLTTRSYYFLCIK